MHDSADASASSALTTEDVPMCCLCGDGATEHLFTSRDRQHGIPGTFGLVRCTTCSLVRLSPRPTRSSLADYYPEDDYYAYSQPAPRGARVLARARDSVRSAALTSIGYPAGNLTRPVAAVGRRLTPAALRRRATYAYDGFPPFTPAGRALDVGCGNGAFLAVLARHGWDACGVDTSPAAAHAAAVRGIKVHVGEIAEAPFPPRSFAFVHMSHSIEHVWDPVATLRHAFDLLRPGGLLYVETPNVTSFTARRCGPYWFPLESPRHLWLFDPGTLTQALRRSGIEVTKIWTKSFPALRWESTYRIEERTGQLLPERPALQPRDMPRGAVLGAAAGFLRLVGRDSGEIICCWARRP